LIAAAFASVAMCAQAADMSGDERSDLRQRAQEFQNQRARNPDFQPGERRMQPEYVTPKSDKRAAKSGKHAAKSGKHAAKSGKKATKSKRTASAQKQKTGHKSAGKGKSAKTQSKT
jgi:hypothetical protein